MNIEEKKKLLEGFCENRDDCDDCILSKLPYCDEKNWDCFTDKEIDECYNLAFGNYGTCNDCQFCECDECDFPCKDCTHNYGEINHFKQINSGTIPEEINHPDRYAGGKFECIEVMVDVFGADAVKHFCILNAFKYIWRAEKKNGVEDIKKAVWYLNKYIELGGDE